MTGNIKDVVIWYENVIFQLSRAKGKQRLFLEIMCIFPIFSSYSELLELNQLFQLKTTHICSKGWRVNRGSGGTPGEKDEIQNVPYFSPVGGCVPMGGWIAWSGHGQFSRDAWVRLFQDCGVGVVLCYNGQQALLELSNPHIHTHPLTRTQFWGGAELN